MATEGRGSSVGVMEDLSGGRSLRAGPGSDGVFNHPAPSEVHTTYRLNTTVWDSVFTPEKTIWDKRGHSCVCEGSLHCTLLFFF